jgi:hypothetical protein
VTVWQFDDPADFDINDPVFFGLVSDYTFDTSTGTLQLNCTVNSEPFEDNVIDAKYGGTGGADGVEDLKDKFKPACFGDAQNVEPVMIDTVNNVLQVHAYGSIESIDNVYERAMLFDPSLGDYPSYTDLVAADIPEGFWGTCLAEGMFRLGAPPFGLITADVKGDNVGGFHQTTAEIIQRLCEIKGVDPAYIDAASMTAFAAACPEPIDLYVTIPSALMDTIQELALPCNAQASLSWTGLLQITRFGLMPTTSTLTLDAQGRQQPPVTQNVELGVSAPYWRMEMEATRCWRVHSKDEIAFLDDDAPVTIYRRYPTKPDTPTGNDIPDGWLGAPPAGYLPPVNVAGFDQFGAVWQSVGMQHGGITSDDGWSEPVVMDSFYPGWTLVSQNTGAKVLGTANGLKATSDLNPDDDYTTSPNIGYPAWPYCFINRPVSGPGALSFRVRGAGDRIAAGVIPYDPAIADAHFSYGDIKDGFLVVQNDDYVTDFQDPATGDPSPITGVFIFEEYSPTSGYVRNQYARMSATPTAECLYQMVFNGETVEHYIGGAHIRTHLINNSWEDLLDYWVVFILGSPDAEIYDIQWGPATHSHEIDFRLDESFGALRRMKDQNGWEVYAPEIHDGFGVGWLLSKEFSGACYAKAKIGGVSGAFALSILEIGGVGSLTFYPDFTVEVRRTVPTLLVDTMTWAPGDEWGISYDRKKIRWFQNGGMVHDRKLSPPSATDLYLEFGANSSFYDIDLVFQAEGTLVKQQTQLNAVLLTPIADTTPVATGSYIDIGQTPDVVYSVTTDTDSIIVSWAVHYTKTAGTAASFTPQIQLQRSTNGGTSWSDVGAAVVGPASTGTTQQQVGTYTDTIVGSGKARYRLLIENTVAGTFTVTEDGTIVAEWQS